MKTFFWIILSLSIIFLSIIWIPEVLFTSEPESLPKLTLDTIAVDSCVVAVRVQKDTFNNNNVKEEIIIKEKESDWKSNTTFIIGAFNSLLALAATYKKLFPKKRKRSVIKPKTLK